MDRAIRLLIMLCLLLPAVSAVTEVKQINLTISNNTVVVVTPDTTFQTTCGQNLDKVFDIVYTYDQTINNTIFYNNTVVMNCSTNQSCIQDETNASLILQYINATMSQCIQAKRSCDDLYFGNITHTLNISSGDIREDINNTLVNFTANIQQIIGVDKALCDDYKQRYERCRDVDMEKLRLHLNNTEVKLNSAERWTTIYGVMLGITCLGWVAMLVVQFGKAMKGSLKTKEGDLKK